MTRGRHRSVLLAFIAGALSMSGCDSAARDGDQRQLDVLTEAPEASPVSSLIEQQRRFVRTLADPGSDPSSYMSTQFEVVDWADTTTHPSRGLAGQGASGQDYLAALSERVPTEFAELRAVEVQLRGPDRAAIISRHPSGAHSITHWLRRNDGWRASILILNVPADVVGRVRRESAGSRY